MFPRILNIKSLKTILSDKYREEVAWDRPSQLTIDHKNNPPRTCRPKNLKWSLQLVQTVQLGTGRFPLSKFSLCLVRKHRAIPPHINKQILKRRHALVLITYCKRLAVFCTSHRAVIIPIILKAYPADALLLPSSGSLCAQD